MKGVIANCLKDLVIEKFGKDKWHASLEDAGLDRNTLFTAISDVDDAAVMKLVNSVCKVLGIDIVQAADAFGDYWVNDFAPKYYANYYEANPDARSFLMAMDEVHVNMTKRMTNARPPRFKYESPDEKTLIMHYDSHRPMIDFAAGLVKGVGRYFKQPLTVAKIDDTKLRITFG